MAYERLQELGADRFSKILNKLMRGEPAMYIAREIQGPPPQGWGLFQDVQEKTLCQQLLRLRQQAAEGTFGTAAAKRIAEGHTPQIERLKNVSVQVLSRLEELSDIQRQRVLDLVQKEKAMPLLVGAQLVATNAVFNDYRQLLLDIQKVRFDLGLDAFLGPVGGTTTVRGGQTTVTAPDGTTLQKQVFEAITTIESIFDHRQIPRVES